MTTLESLSDGAEAASRPGHSAPTGYELKLELVDGAARITLVGALDESAADAVGGMVGFAGAASAGVEIVGDGVSSVDPGALELLVAAARERRQHRLAEVIITAYSVELREALRSAGFSLTLPLSLSA